MQNTHSYMYEGIETLTQAVDYLNDVFSSQLEHAAIESTPPNVAVAGDARVREAFLTLLTPSEQRCFFLRIILECRYWPRLRTLIGSPPYTFLRTEDEGVLRAAGICRGRMNMSHIDPTATNYTEFGKGHYEDSFGRLYRIITKERYVDNQLPWLGMLAGVKVVADVRVKKRNRVTKSSIAMGTRCDIAKQSLVFPRVGDTVALRLVAPLRSMGVDKGGEDEYTLCAYVDFGRQKAPNSPIARLVLRVN